MRFLLLVAVLIGCTSPTLAEEVEIIRDQRGIPHIYGPSREAVFFGYGYAVGEDRLFQMEMTLRTGTGRIAEVLGPGWVEFDAMIRAGFDPADIRRQIEGLAPRERAVLDSYAAGLNAAIDKVQQQPESLMPKEFVDLEFEPSRWTAYEVAMVFAGSMAHRYADFNEELSNLAFYQDLAVRHGADRAWAIFTTLQPLYDATSPTTVPGLPGAPVAGDLNAGHDGGKPPTHLGALAGLAQGEIRMARDAQGRYLPLTGDERVRHIASQLAQSGIPGMGGFSSASNVWAVQKTKATGANAILVNGPQFGWSTPSYVYGVGLHAPDYDVSGNTLLAYPGVVFGHNNHVGWGSTAGLSDLVDLYHERLNPENAEQYWYRGEWRDFAQREEVIEVKGAEPVTITVRRSVHGPVIQYDPEAGAAYAKARSWEGSELDALMVWVNLPETRTVEEARDTLRRMATDINFYLLDRSGSIAYTHGGLYPVRANGHDIRLPASGEGEMDWQGFLPFAENPQIVNPPTEFLQNWNNRPARRWPSSDNWWINWAGADRAQILIDELWGAKAFSPDELWNINARASFADANWVALKPLLERALAPRPLGPSDMQAFAALRSWDGLWVDRNGDGMFDGPQPLIMEVWLRHMADSILRETVGDAHFYRFASPGYPTAPIAASINASPGTKAIVRAITARLDGQSLPFDLLYGDGPLQVVQETFLGALKAIRTEHGFDPSGWQLAAAPLQFRPVNFRGVPQGLIEGDDVLVPTLPVIMNRGSENNLFVADDSGIKAFDVFAPGQSGFISPDGTQDPHFADQMTLYSRFEHMPVPFSKEEAEAAASSRTVLQVPQ